MNYKNQILKQLSNGKYDKKTYLGMVNKKSKSLSKENSDHIEAKKVNITEVDMNTLETTNPIINSNSSDEIIQSEDVVFDEADKDSMIERKISELENYLGIITIEIDNLSKNQKNIISAINKLSTEISMAKNKITR